MECISLIDRILEDISKDPQLIDYARESINQTLKVEFSEQIQPIRHSEYDSEIILKDGRSTCVDVKLANNRVINDGNPVYYSSTVNRIYFIDDPYVLDAEPMVDYGGLISGRVRDKSSIINNYRIVSHRDKITKQIKERASTSVLEQVVLNEKLGKIKERIDRVMPGSFDFSSSDDCYVIDGAKLRVSNLATGSKMFSIIKILFDKGLLDGKTVLILDEPEAHLHPQWQNEFAEIIVLLIKELGVKVLLTSHSSNFVLAIDAFARKYELSEISHFYQTVSADGGMVNFECVDGDLGVIYQDFLEFLSEAKAVRDKYLGFIEE